MDKLSSSIFEQMLGLLDKKAEIIEINEHSIIYSIDGIFYCLSVINDNIENKRIEKTRKRKMDK